MAMELPVDLWDKIISFLGHESHLEPLSLVSKTFLSITNRHKQILKITDQTSRLLPSLLHRFPNLKHFDFSKFQDDAVPIITQLADLNFRIETLDLSNHESFPLEKLPPSISASLKSFKIHIDYYVHGYYVEMIVKLFPNLQELGLGQQMDGSTNFTYPSGRYRGSYRSSYKPFLALGSLKNLRRIHFRENDWVGDDVLTSISKNCPNLEEIEVKECKYVTHIGITSALGESKNLKMIRLEGSHYAIEYSIDHRKLQWPSRLSEMDFTKMEVSDGLLESMAEANLPLKKVTLACCWRFTFDGMMQFFDKYNDLDYLALVGIRFLEQSSIRSLSKCFKKLRHMKLSQCGGFSVSKLLILLKSCPLLETVDMASEDGDVSFVENDIVPNHQIKTLNLSNNPNLCDKSLKKIAASCPNLESLKLNNCVAISSKGVGEITRNCSYLKHLEIHGCLKVRNLNLDSKTRKLEWLGASSSGLDDRGLFHIAKKCLNLVYLDLSKCAVVTSKGVTEVVSNCTKLKEIDLGECMNMRSQILVSWMIATRPSLRKVIPPYHHGHILVDKCKFEVF